MGPEIDYQIHAHGWASIACQQDLLRLCLHTWVSVIVFYLLDFSKPSPSSFGWGPACLQDLGVMVTCLFFFPDLLHFIDFQSGFLCVLERSFTQI